MNLSRCPRWWVTGIVLVGLWQAPLVLADDGGTKDSQPIYAFGIGVSRMPDWSGSHSQRNQAIPYFDIEIPNVGTLTVDNGLQLDFIRGAVLHGGFYGNYEWGRTYSQMGPIAGKVPSLSPRFDSGGYLEWQFTKSLDAGMDVSHDINGAGAYFKLYAEWDLPAIGYLQHSLQLRWQAMNGAGMNRLYGITPSQAQALQTSPWRPGAGARQASLEYDLFMPTSRHTGLALSLEYGRLLGDAANSPLVQRYGSASQPTETLAFIYDF